MLVVLLMGWGWRVNKHLRGNNDGWSFGSVATNLALMSLQKRRKRGCQRRGSCFWHCVCAASKLLPSTIIHFDLPGPIIGWLGEEF